MGGRGKKSAVVKVGHRTGGKASASKKRKSAISMANAAGLRAVKALEARRRGSGDTEEEADELLEGEEEGDEEEEEGEESVEINEQESQEAETQMEPQIRKRKRSKVLNVSLPLHPSICPDVIRESARSAGQILKWVVSGIFKTKPMLPTSSESFCHGSLFNTDWRLSPLHFLLCNK